MATSIDQKNFVKTALRLPPELHSAVHEAAQRSGRSYNAELVERVQMSFDSDKSNEHRKAVDTALSGMQTMLAFHIRQFYDLLPKEVQQKPINRMVRELAVSLGHGTPKDIEQAMIDYFGVRAGAFAAVANEFHARRQQMDDAVKAVPATPEETDQIVKRIQAKP